MCPADVGEVLVQPVPHRHAADEVAVDHADQERRGHVPRRQVAPLPVRRQKLDVPVERPAVAADQEVETLGGELALGEQRLGLVGRRQGAQQQGRLGHPPMVGGRSAVAGAAGPGDLPGESAANVAGMRENVI